MTGITDYVFAQDTITSISVSGLKRTKLKVVEKALQGFIGRETEAQDQDSMKRLSDQVKACILDTEILDPLSVTLLDDPRGEGKILTVELREKWAVFGVPVFFADPTGIVAGGAFYDGNAFGMNHRIALAGLYQTGGLVLTVLYMVPPAGVHNFGGDFNFLYTREERRDSDQKKNTLRRFNSASITAEADLTYQLTETIMAEFSLGYLGRLLRDTPNPLEAPASGAHIIKPGTEFSIRKSSWDGYLLSEERISLGYAFGTGLNSPSFHSASLGGVYEKSLVPGFRTNFRFGGLFAPHVPVLFESGPGAAEINILPRSFSARHYAGLSLGLEKFLFRFPFGTISFLGSWQMVYSYGPVIKNSFDYGLLGSLFFYMSRVAIPAIGLGAAYNIPADFFQFSFMIGMKL